MNLESASCLRTVVRQLILCSSQSAPARIPKLSQSSPLLSRGNGNGNGITSSSLQSGNGQPGCRWFHTTNQANHLMKLTRCRVVDNSPIGKQAMAEGKPPKIIHIYNNNRKVGGIGDRVLVAIRGEMKKAIIVGVKKNQRAFMPRTDSNSIVLIEENGTPLGTRIHVPIPIILRKMLKEKSVAKGPDYTKLLALATRFI